MEVKKTIRINVIMCNGNFYITLAINQLMGDERHVTRAK
jgi:hypothetical protein